MEDALPVLKAKIDSTWVTVGGPGVAAGGTTGQLLSKASASDYHTQWTSTPTLADLTLTGTLTSKHAVRAAAIVQASGGFSSGYNFGFASATKTGTGTYRVTFSTSFANPIPLVNPYGSWYLVVVTALASTYVDVAVLTPAQAPADGTFIIHLVAP
jgi:hypothetical protein